MKISHPAILHARGEWGLTEKPVMRILMLKQFDSDQLWVALIIGLVILCLAVYRMWML
ncbi:MAG: hypothetical protein V1844_05690 [Pseudomonadota bacterium]